MVRNAFIFFPIPLRAKYNDGWINSTHTTLIPYTEVTIRLMGMVFPYRTLPNVLINYFHSPTDGVVQTKSEVTH